MKNNRLVSLFAAASLFSLSACGKRENAAVEFFNNFPEQSVFSKDIEKIPEREAKYCLVHIRQKHGEDFPSFIEEYDKINAAKIALNNAKRNNSDVNSEKISVLEELIRQRESEAEHTRVEVRRTIGEISDVQKEIYGFVISQPSSLDIKSVRSEGLSLELSDRQELLASLAVRNGELVEGGYTSLEEMTNPEKFLMYAGADLMLGIKRDFRILPGENALLHSEVYPLFKKLTLDLIDKKISKEEFDRKAEELNNRRENQALDIISKAREPYTFLIYGGSHDFRDNVGLWNKENPEDKFSLIVVTPKSYKERQ